MSSMILEGSCLDILLIRVSIRSSAAVCVLDPNPDVSLLEKSEATLIRRCQQ